jgi:hypothetical protein
MGRPRKYASNAERQSAYRSRQKPFPVKKVERSAEVAVEVKKARCTAFTPRGTKCKFCGKSH